MSGQIPNSIINTEVGDGILAVKSPQQALQIADLERKCLQTELHEYSTLCFVICRWTEAYISSFSLPSQRSSIKVLKHIVIRQARASMQQLRKSGAP